MPVKGRFKLIRRLFLAGMALLLLFCMMAAPVMADSGYRLRYGEFTDSKDHRIGHLIALLLQDMDVSADTGEELVYENQTSGSFVSEHSEHTSYNYDGNISLNAKLVDINEFREDPRSEPDIILTGEMEFQINVEVLHERRSVFEIGERTDYHSYSYSGPFRVNEHGSMGIGYDGVDFTYADEPVRVDHNQVTETVYYLPDNVRVYFDQEDFDYSTSFELIPLYEMIKELDETFSLNSPVSFSYNKSVTNEGQFSDEFISAEGTLTFDGVHQLEGEEHNAIPWTRGTVKYTGEAHYETRPYSGDPEERRRTTEIEAEGSSIMLYLTQPRAPFRIDAEGQFNLTRKVSTYGPDGLITSSDDSYIGSRSFELTYDVLSEIENYTTTDEQEMQENLSRGWGLPSFVLDFSQEGVVIVDTDADAAAGETDVSVPAAIVIGMAGLAAAAAGAAGASGSRPGRDDGDDTGSSYKMVLNKDFGDKLKYNDDPVYVYARMAEVSSSGEEIPRPDLTAAIEIFSDSRFLEVGSSNMVGDYMNALVRAVGDDSANLPDTGVVSFRFTGEGGVFQNNVTFNLVGDCYIRLPDSSLSVLAASGKEFTMPYELMDFMNEDGVEVEVKCMQSDPPFELSTGENDEGQRLITVIDKAEKKPLERFYDPFNCEITARNDKEHARTVFRVVMCHEGLLPNFLGREKEINAYPEEDGNIRETLVVYQVGLWNDDKQDLERLKPENLEVTCRDEEGIFEALGVKAEINDDYHRDDAVQYKLQAERALPATEKFKGMLEARCVVEENSFEHQTEIVLLPDVLQYSANFKEEYKNCLHVIKTYMPERFRERKLEELEASLSAMGVEDLKVFRDGCWQIAQRCIMQEKEDYMIESYWYDEAIATAELLVYVGDIAFGLAIAPLGGPLTGFVITNVKDSFLELVEVYVKSDSFGFNEVQGFISTRFTRLAGQADFVFSPPDPSNRKQLVAWLVCFTMYRIAYRWWFDKDDRQQPIGLTEAIKRGVLDLAGKGAGMLMENYVKDSAKKMGWDNTDFIKKDQAQYDAQKQQAMDAVSKAVNDLLDFLASIKKGGVSFS